MTWARRREFLREFAAFLRSAKLHEEIAMAHRWSPWLTTSCAGLACLFIGVAARAGEPEWKVGLAQAKITLERAMLMSGYASRTRPFEKVGQDLYV